jgi:carbon monoxide dehydrogenase subunit G
MPRLHRTITVPKPLDETFEFVADFSTVPEWDPGVSEAHQTNGHDPAVGATYSVTAVFNGRDIPMTYVTTVLERPHRITLEGEGSTIRAVDDIRFKAKDESNTQIDYVADLNLKGALRLVQPFLKGSFDKLADRAMAGLERRLG